MPARLAAGWEKLDDRVRERGNAEARDRPFVLQEGYGDWRYGAEFAVAAARRMSSVTSVG